MGLTQRFLLSAEASVPAFFSAVMLVVTAVIASLLSWVTGGFRMRDGRTWAFIAALLLFMAFDEAAMIHEIVLELTRRRPEDGILYYFWVVPFGGLAFICMMVLLPFWWRLPNHTKWWLATAATLFIASAIGMELVESALVVRFGEQAAYARWDVITSITLEESGEMIAVGMALYALLQHLSLIQGTYGKVRFGLS